jgi:hypothetical protein
MKTVFNIRGFLSRLIITMKIISSYKLLRNDGFDLDTQKTENRKPKLETRNPEPATRNPKPVTRKPGTRNPKPAYSTTNPGLSKFSLL